MREFIQIGRSLALGLIVAAVGGGRADGSFHLMQIEQIIGGVNGDLTAQAIQLRMRSSGQNILSAASLRASDAAGGNEVLLDNMSTNVASGAAGSRVLITTPNFANYVDLPLVSDFTMDPIPVSYLPAGQVAFSNSSGSTDYWVLSWGGSGFTGSTTGVATNDADGQFGPPFPGPLPSTSLQALRFLGAASDRSTTNANDYALTAGAATFTNNAGTNFTLVAPAADSADFDEDSDVDGADFFAWQRHAGGPGGLAQGDADGNNLVGASDLAIWQRQFGASGTTGLPARPTPEPDALLLAAGLAMSIATRTRRRR